MMINSLHGVGLATANSRRFSPIMLLARSSQQQIRLSALLSALEAVKWEISCRFGKP